MSRLGRAAVPREISVRVETVADVVTGAVDGGGETIDRVFHKRAHYAIYAIGNQVRPQFSDDQSVADKQLRTVAPLFLLRDELHYLMRGAGGDEGLYTAQVANAFRLGLEDQVETARSILETALRNAGENQARRGRLVYLAVAVLLGIALATCLTLTASDFLGADLDAAILAAGAGALGAMLSICQAVRSRTVAPVEHWLANVTDGAVRIVIGVLSGLFVYLFVDSGLTAGLSIDGGQGAGTADWRVVVLIGFAAGFLERTVPDLLEKREVFKPTPAEKAGLTEPT